jgi:hypothetical protein
MTGVILLKDLASAGVRKVALLDIVNDEGWTFLGNQETGV